MKIRYSYTRMVKTHTIISDKFYLIISAAVLVTIAQTPTTSVYNIAPLHKYILSDIFIASTTLLCPRT